MICSRNSLIPKVKLESEFMEAASMQSTGKEDIAVSLADAIQNLLKRGIFNAAKQIGRIRNAGRLLS